MTVSLAYALTALFLVFLRYQIVASKENDIWNPATVSKAFLNSPTLTKNRMTIQTGSDVVCAMKASQTQWANLFCFNDGMCDISDFVAVPNEGLTSISDPVQCMTKLNVNVGVCQKRGTGVYVSGIGILIVNPILKSYNESVTYCASITGCQLWTPQGNSSVMVPMIRNITKACDTKGYYFIGLIAETLHNYKDLNGNPWNFLTTADRINVASNWPFLIIAATEVQYQDSFLSDTNGLICHCGN